MGSNPARHVEHEMEEEKKAFPEGIGVDPVLSGEAFLLPPPNCIMQMISRSKWRRLYYQEKNRMIKYINNNNKTGSDFTWILHNLNMIMLTM